jgi:3-oxoacyl-[acyl-carrier protein] reductase
VIRSVGPSGRVVILGTPPEQVEGRERIAQRALEGFVRSVGKELKRGATAQLVYVAEGAEEATESTLRFLLSAKSAFVDAQVIRIGAEGKTATAPASWEKPLDGKVALVTGASRGIGAAIAETLARDGAHVVALDIPAQGGDLSKVANKIGGSALQLDITSPSAPAKLAEYLKERHGGVDVVVHNAGVTKDRTLAKMPEDRWQSLMEVNLLAPERITEALLPRLRHDGRIVCVSSMSAIAGNAGQTNYATSKAGLLDLVSSLELERGITINAVAPGFIETQMTASMPIGVREAGRRMNSLRQGGLPVDVAETVAWLASSGVERNVIRVCGQSLLGA